MQPARALLLYLLAVFVGGALVAPWLFHAVHWAAHHLPFGHDFWSRLARQPFHRYVNRCLYVPALLGLWPLAKSLGLSKASDLGWSFHPKLKSWLGTGFLLGFATLAAAALLSWVSGNAAFDTQQTTGRLVKHLGNSIAAALAVAPLEETLFRGLFLAGLAKSFSPKTALAMSSFLYAWVHFFQKPPPPDVIHAGSGFQTLAEMTRGLIDPALLFPGFLSLFVAGWILGALFLATRSLWLPVGVHAGWIFWLKSFGLLFNLSKPSTTASWLWGSEKLYDGVSSLVLLLVVGACLKFLPVFKSTVVSTTPPVPKS